MGTGFHGGFGATKGSINNIVVADSTLVGNGRGKELKRAAKKVKKEADFTDVAVHGSEKAISYFRMEGDTEREIVLSHRSLVKFLKSDKGYSGGKIRLLSCSTGSDKGSFAQDLANKLGVVVRAPSDKLYIFPNGYMVIGPDAFHNTGRWIDFYPNKKKKG